MRDYSDICLFFTKYDNSAWIVHEEYSCALYRHLTHLVCKNRFQHREEGWLLSSCLVCMLFWTVISRFYWVCSMYVYICWIQLNLKWVYWETLLGAFRVQRLWILVSVEASSALMISGCKQKSLPLPERAFLPGRPLPSRRGWLWTRICLAQSFIISKFYRVSWQSKQRPTVRDIEFFNQQFALDKAKGIEIYGNLMFLVSCFKGLYALSLWMIFQPWN